MEEELFGREDVDSVFGDSLQADPMHRSRLSAPMARLAASGGARSGGEERGQQADGTGKEAQDQQLTCAAGPNTPAASAQGGRSGQAGDDDPVADRSTCAATAGSNIGMNRRADLRHGRA
jgi:hypothetical protein